MKNPLPYDTVPAANYKKLEPLLHGKELRERSAVRVAASPEFTYITEDLEMVKKRLAENQLSLNIEQRRKEIEEQKSRREKRMAERAATPPSDEKRFSLTLDEVNKRELQLVTHEKKPSASEENAEAQSKAVVDDDEEDEAADSKPPVDAVRNETVNILGDLIGLTKGSTTTTASTNK